MATHAELKITADAVMKAVADGAKSPTAVAKTLGFKSGSSSIIKRLNQAVPDLMARLKANQKQADAKAKSAVPEGYLEPECVPFRSGSGYAMVWSLLFHHRDKGISKTDLIARYKALSGKPEKNAGFDVHVVTSSREDGSSHKSAAKAAQTYWLERAGDLLRLRLVGEGKK